MSLVNFSLFQLNLTLNYMASLHYQKSICYKQLFHANTKTLQQNVAILNSGVSQTSRNLTPNESQHKYSVLCNVFMYPSALHAKKRL